LRFVVGVAPAQPAGKSRFGHKKTPKRVGRGKVEERRNRFEQLADYLRGTALPAIPDVAPTGAAKVHFAFLESYFSNYVEGTRFSIEEAQNIVLRNQIIGQRPKDSHDVLGVFRLAVTSPQRDTLPPPGEAFLLGLQERHADMLKNRPEAEPGHIKTEANYAGSTKFVEPGFVRGTFQEYSPLALSIPEGLGRAIFYAFLVAEIHPFVDGNGRLSRLMMNAELSRLGLCRIIIPTLYHPQYVDCTKRLTNNNEPQAMVRAIAKMAVWCAQFAYSDITTVVAQMRACNAMEESAASFRLIDLQGKVVG
jgi:hypothetical protein